MADREVLIFWCLKRVRWKNILFFRVGSNWWVGSSQTESLMEWVSNTPKQLWHPKISPISNETSLQTPKNKKDTTRYQQTMPNVFKHSHHPLNMRDWVRLEPILNFGKTVKGKNFSTWLFSDLKISKPPYLPLPKIIGLAIFLIFHVCQREITIYSLFGLPCTTMGRIWLPWKFLRCSLIWKGPKIKKWALSTWAESNS